MKAPDEATLMAMSLARRCIVCGAEATVTCPGADEIRAMVATRTANGGYRKRVEIVSAAREDIDLCLADAAKRWPWRSEAVAEAVAH
jgi:hypothetical protein